MFRLKNAGATNADVLVSSRLYDQNGFYPAFIKDLGKAKRQVIIESPFITTKRIEQLMPLLQKLRKNKVQVVVNTRPPEEHEGIYQYQVEQAIGKLQRLGVLVLFTGGHHRKLAVIDEQIIWEGSLNILSQNDSCEIMRRVYSAQLANQMLGFLRLKKFIG